MRHLRRAGLVSRTVLAVRMSGLIVIGLLLVALTIWRPNDVSWGLYCPLVVLAGMFLSPRPFLIVCAVYSLCLLLTGFMVRGWSTVQVVTLGAVGLTMVLMYARTRSRERLGVQGSDGDDMLVNLRDQLTSLADVETLPTGWHVEHWIQSAYGDKFSGDFAVSSMSPDGESLEIVLVDLAGKGAGVGTIALLFSGAFGGLLGQVDRSGCCRRPTPTCCDRAGPRASPRPCTCPCTCPPGGSPWAPRATRARCTSWPARANGGRSTPPAGPP